jgi:hypothetical protein
MNSHFSWCILLYPFLVRCSLIKKKLEYLSFPTIHIVYHEVVVFGNSEANVDLNAGIVLSYFSNTRMNNS